VITDHPPVQVIGFPVNLSAALTMPTTTRSAHGLTKLTTAFDAVSSNGAAALDGVTSKGFTIFAPVDDAWTGPDDVGEPCEWRGRARVGLVALRSSLPRFGSPPSRPFPVRLALEQPVWYIDVHWSLVTG
jgi:hypothetical protein